MFNKITVGLLTVLLALSLAGCGVKEKVNEKISEKVTEGIMGKAAGGDVDVDLDGDQVTFKDQDGNKLTVGDSKWPDTGAANLLPELKKGRILSIANSDEACVVIMENITEKDFQQYIETLKAKGFTKEVTEYTNESGQGYNAYLNENTAVFVLYDAGNKGITINLQTSK